MIRFLNRASQVRVLPGAPPRGRAARCSRGREGPTPPGDDKTAAGRDAGYGTRGRARSGAATRERGGQEEEGKGRVNRVNPNTVYLGGQNLDPGLWRSRRATMLGTLDDEVRHLALDGSGVVTKPPFGQELEEQLGVHLTLGVVEDLRGKNPGATPRCGVPPGASE